MDPKKIYAKKGLDPIPRLLGLIDRNPYSPTYGCFDRNYWHYKVLDFPSIMYQIGSLPLALVYKYKFPRNKFYKKERIKELALASIKFLDKTLHKDGSGDEFYPFERALGATTIALCRCTEAYIILDVKNRFIEDIFKRIGNWILKNDEPGLMSNHQAAAALGLLNTYLITKEQKYLDGAKNRIKRFDSLQSEEGWFQEYDGCDPGYLTVAIDFLADYYRKTKDKGVLKILEKAIKFSSYFIHPDGSYGGEYGSRNSYHFVSRGFEIMANKIPLAANMNNKWLEGLLNGKQEFIDDDRYFIDESASYLQSYLFFARRNVTSKLPSSSGNFKRYFKDAKIYIEKNGDYYIIISLAKGGVFKLFKKDRQVYNDCGFIGSLENNKIVTTQIIYPENEIKIGKKIIVEGNFHSVSDILPTTLKSILFRTGLISVGRQPKTSRFMKEKLTKKLITAKNKEPLTFKRTFEIRNEIKITDKIKLDAKKKLKSLSIGTDHTVIHVPGSRYYQEGCMQDWTNLDNSVKKLNKYGEIEITRLIK